MDIGALLIGSAMLVGTFPFVLNPFQKGSSQSMSSGSGQSSPEPEEDHTAMLLAIRDLDFDYSLGKVAEEDYFALRGFLVREAAERLNHAETMDPLEDLIQKRRVALQQNSGKTCPACQRPVQPGDIYCPSCGKPLTNP